VQMAFRRTRQELLGMLMAHAYLVRDIENTLESLLGGERAMDRAINFTGSIQTVGAVLGDQPKFALDDWKKPETKQYPLVRTSPWVPKTPHRHPRANPQTAPAQPVPPKAIPSPRGGPQSTPAFGWSL
jgi:hypothetical protein